MWSTFGGLSFPDVEGESPFRGTGSTFHASIGEEQRKKLFFAQADETGRGFYASSTA